MTDSANRPDAPAASPAAPSPGTSSAPRARQRTGLGRRIRGAVLRYRVMAIVTGTLLLILVFVAMPLKYFADSSALVAVVGTAHGFLFMVYLLATLDLGARVRWPLWRLGLTMIAGTIPFLSFVMERRVHRELVVPGSSADAAPAGPPSTPAG